MRVLNTNFGQTNHGVFTKNTEALTNDFFVNLLELDTTWKAVSEADDLFEGRNRATGELKWTGSRVDLIFGSNTELRALLKFTQVQILKRNLYITSWQFGTR
jgi:catalase-peroxidase